MTTLSKNKIVLGLSGGVDSTTAALLLKEQGFEVIGFYFDVTGTNEKGREEARALAERLDIRFIDRDVSKDFEKIVIENFCSEYMAGRTPNPCVVCNPAIKFKNLTDVADEVGSYYIATGHYARVIKDEAGGIYYIRRGASEKKDQSYMLYRLGQDVLSRLVLPLGEYEAKEEIREIARSRELPNADNADSQEICFIADDESYGSFLADRGLSCPEGDFVSPGGKVLGRHKGIINYTIGQRKGLGIALGKPAFVTDINPTENTVTLGENEDLFKTKVYSSGNFFSETGGNSLPAKYINKKILGKIRYASKPSEALITDLGDGRLLTEFTAPQRAAAPGQSIVFYDGDRVIGGGFIK